MDLGAAGLKQQPFPTHGKPLAIIPYYGQRKGLEMLREAHVAPSGLALLQAPALAGKSTLVRTYIDSIDHECAVALVDGKGLDTSNLLLTVLRQFGYEIDLCSANELLGLVRVFALQQASANVPPLLVVENVHTMSPGALRALNELAALRVRMGAALKIVLVSDKSLGGVLKAPAVEAVARRVTHDFHLRPMTPDETRNFLHTKLRLAGSKRPASVLPDLTCEEICTAAGGWPGIVDRIALLALARTKALPIAVEHVEHPVLPGATWEQSGDNGRTPEALPPDEPPQLVVTNNGSVLDELTMDRPRLLIGRSEHNDISIPSRFISRHHALLVRNGNSTFLMDLNSTNGTFVNAQRVSNHVLMHDDVITIGHHKIKFSDPFATRRGQLEGDAFADTAIMQTLEDMRSLLARENTALLPTATEDLPTIRT